MFLFYILIFLYIQILIKDGMYKNFIYTENIKEVLVVYKTINFNFIIAKFK
ncbi:hypothetical protein UT300003_22550 [Clostridium sardiniense]